MNDIFSLNGKVALSTGAAYGIDPGHILYVDVGILAYLGRQPK